MTYIHEQPLRRKSLMRGSKNFLSSWNGPVDRPTLILILGKGQFSPKSMIATFCASSRTATPPADGPEAPAGLG